MLVGGLLATATPTLLAAHLTGAVTVALSVGGGLVLFAGALWDDTVCRRGRDERQAEIHYRAGYNAMLALVALFGTLLFAMVNVDYRPGPTVVWALTMTALPLYFGSVAYYRRVM
jgi:archaellum biogenesis protein FlaJ (TadC family)